MMMSMSMAAATTIPKTKLVQPPPIPPSSQVVPQMLPTSSSSSSSSSTSTTRTMMMMMRTHLRTPPIFSATQSRNSNKNQSIRFGVGDYPSSYIIKFAEQRSSAAAGLVGSSEEEAEEEAESSSSEDSSSSSSRIKANLCEALQGINRGIFGVPSAKKSDIEGLVKLLESKNPTPDPTLFLDKVGGCWKLVYSTITILGSKRTKLGLRDFISLGDFFQTIDVTRGKAVNVIMFNVRGLNLFNGQLKIEASFKTASNSRVDIKYSDSTITPNQLMNVFRKNYELLLDIFNPEGWLEITYVDDTLRIGRDDKGNIFILERFE